MGPRVESIEIKVGVLGASGVGKTALINMVCLPMDRNAGP